MTEQRAAPTPTPTAQADRQPADTSANQQAPRPWRTEGMPRGDPGRQRRRWITTATWIVGYGVLFGMLTLQDRLSGPQAVPYTEFKGQVAAKNVTEIFATGDTIEGALKKAAPLPGQSDRTYQQFTTERPTFANDDLLAELTQGEATVRATPIVQHRGFLTNLLISMAPILLIVAFYAFMFRRQQAAMDGMLGGGKQRRVDPEWADTAVVTRERTPARLLWRDPPGCYQVSPPSDRALRSTTAT